MSLIYSHFWTASKLSILSAFDTEFMNETRNDSWDKWRHISKLIFGNLVFILIKLHKTFQINIFQLKYLNITNCHIIILSNLPRKTETQRQFHNYKVFFNFL